MGKEILTENKRLLREHRTISRMVTIFCKAKHQSEELCPACQELLDYAGQRLTYCPFGEKKPVCAKCPIHCYRQDMREKVIAVMGYSGPRMLYRHPVLALRHLWDSITGSNKQRQGVPQNKCQQK